MTSSLSSPPSEPSTPTSAAQLLSAGFPPLRRYWPNLQRVSGKQTAFLLLDCLEAFFGGAAGPGKSETLLAGALQYVDVPGYSAAIFRRTYTDLSLPGAVMARANEWLSGTDAKRGKEGKEWTFPSGATLTFGYLDNENDRFRYQSAEFQYIAFDELSQFSERMYEYLFSRLRATGDVRVPLRMRSASNPGGVGHGWVKRRFVRSDAREPGVIFVPARLDDHPDEEYKAGYRLSLAKLDEVTRHQLEEGDWDTAEGLAFRVSEASLITPVAIPPDWRRIESLDHGLANPTCVLAWASDYDGNLITFDSYYSERNQMVSAHAAALLDRRARWWPRDEQGKLTQTVVCYADHDLWGKTGTATRWGEPATLVTEYAEHGVDGGFVQANKNPSAGRARLQELLRPDPERPFPAWHPRYGELGAPRWFIVHSRCRELVEQLQVAPTNPDPVGGKHGAGEIVDPGWEGRDGHAVAAARYGALTWEPATAPAAERPPDDPRAELLWRLEKRLEGGGGDLEAGRYELV